jgi:tripeptide aminopeptidase
MMNKSILPGVIAAMLFLPLSTSVFADADSDYQLSSQVADTYAAIMNDDSVNHALAFLEIDQDNTIAQQIEITEIPAPTFNEKQRAEYFKSQLEALGLDDVTMDDMYNVYGIRRGTGHGHTVYVTAHLDTVFDFDEIKVIEKDGILYAPGIGDDSRGLAAILSMVRAFNASGIQTTGDIIFGGSVHEEGIGNSDGVAAVIKAHPEISGFIAIDEASPSDITYLGTGSYNYKVTYHGPGGHSYQAFGRPSAIHAMGRAIAEIANIKTIDNPKTTYNVGTVEGGTTVNAIATDASMLVDMRSNAADELDRLEKQILDIIQQSVEDENNFRGYDQDKGVSVELDRVGYRPVGIQDPEGINVQTAWAATQALGLQPSLTQAFSTDSNTAIDLGIPSLTLGRGGDGDNIHSPDEWFDPTDAYLGPQRILLTILGYVGVEGVSKPLLDVSSSQ